MQDIDFLPIDYRQQHVQRRSQPWQIVVVFAFGLLVAAAVLGQYHRKRRAEAEMIAVLPQYEMAVQQNRRLAEVQSQLQQARANAELLTYLRHPWPRSQLLAAVLATLPDEITFGAVAITQEKIAQRTPSDNLPHVDKAAEDEAAAKLSAAQRDLKRLREECDQSQTVIRISGFTSDSAALHRYLGSLTKCDLFAKADLESLGSVETKSSASMQFRLTLIVCPGYGQANGPLPCGKAEAVRTAQNSPNGVRP
jgi:Tfp pilus assembly protein PilN